MNIEILNRIISAKKTALPSLRNQNWKTVKTETKKINKLLMHISTNITELNELIYTIAKLICDKRRVLLKNTNRNSKPGWKIQLEMQIKNLQQAKMIEQVKRLEHVRTKRKNPINNATRIQ